MNPQTQPEIKYSIEPFEGCSTFRYKRKNVITHEVKTDEVYGVTEQQGRDLIEHWNSLMPGFWFYEGVEVEKEVKV